VLLVHQKMQATSIDTIDPITNAPIGIPAPMSTAAAMAPISKGPPPIAGVTYLKLRLKSFPGSEITNANASTFSAMNPSKPPSTYPDLYADALGKRGLCRPQSARFALRQTRKHRKLTPH
jgi:hypothetical protein